MAEADLPPSVYHVLVQHLPKFLPHHQQVDLRVVTKEFKHAADRCLDSLNLELADVDTSSNPQAIQLLEKLLSIIMTFPRVKQLTFLYAEPQHVEDIWDGLQPVPTAAVPMECLRMVAASVHAMYQGLLHHKTLEPGELDPHVWVDPLLLLAQHYQEQQMQGPLETGQQHQEGGELQQQHQSFTQAAAAAASSDNNQEHNQSSQQQYTDRLHQNQEHWQQQQGCLWPHLTAVYDCPADPFVLSLLLAVAPNIQQLTFRSQTCSYWEVEQGQSARNWHLTNNAAMGLLNLITCWTTSNRLAYVLVRFLYSSPSVQET